MRRKICRLSVLIPAVTMALFLVFWTIHQNTWKEELSPRVGLQISGVHGILPGMRSSDANHNAGHQEAAERDGWSEEVAEDMRSRRDHLLHACQALTSIKDKYKNISIVSEPHRFLYCPVPKVASTFWTRFFSLLVKPRSLRSPYDVPVTDVVPKYFYKFRLKEEKGPELRNTLNSLNRVVFVRNPYSRLLSIYVDKMLAPNPILWKTWGARIISKIRKNSTPPNATNDKEDICGHDITFSEFVAFSTRMAWRFDEHMEPVHSYCSPCYINFTIVGKMETFKRDAAYVLNALNIPKSQVNFEQWSEESALDAIEDSAKDSLSNKWLQKSLLCVSKDEVLRRILRKLQLRGVISWRYSYRLTPEQVDAMDLSQYKQLLIDARAKFYNPTELKAQKRQAYLEAFKTLSDKQIAEINHVYRNDFKIFGYDLMPLGSIDSKTIPNTQAFNVFQDWDLSTLR